MNSEEKQALISLCRIEIKRWASTTDKQRGDFMVKLMEIALAALEADPVAWVVLAPQGDYIERNSEVVAHLEGTGLAKCRPLYTAAPVPTIPEGWQLVPVDPTWEMLSANGCKDHHKGNPCAHRDKRRRIWAAMLEASHKP